MNPAKILLTDKDGNTTPDEQNWKKIARLSQRLKDHCDAQGYHSSPETPVKLPLTGPQFEAFVEWLKHDDIVRSLDKVEDSLAVAIKLDIKDFKNEAYDALNDLDPFDQYVVAKHLNLPPSAEKNEPIVVRDFKEFSASHLQKLVDGPADPAVLIIQLGAALSFPQMAVLPHQVLFANANAARPVLLPSKLDDNSFWQISNDGSQLLLGNQWPLSAKGGGYSTIRTDLPIPRYHQRYYFEVTTGHFNPTGLGSFWIAIGLCGPDFPLEGANLGARIDSIGIAGSGHVFWNNAEIARSEAWTNTDTIGCCLDRAAHTVRFTKNGKELTFLTSLDIWKFELYPAIAWYVNPSHEPPVGMAEINLGQKPFKFDAQRYARSPTQGMRWDWETKN